MINSQKKFQLNRSFWRPPQFPLKFGSDPFKCEKKKIPFMGFMVFKSTGLDSQFQRKKWFSKICTESRDIGKNVSNFAGLVWKADFGHVLADISGLGAHFSKPIFALKPWVQASRFEYHEPHNLSNFFLPLKGSEPNFGGNSGGLRKLRFGWKFFCELIILFLMGKGFVFICFWHFNFFEQP